MTRRVRIALVLPALLPLLIAGCALPSRTVAEPSIDGTTVDAWVAQLTPDDITAAWRTIPWRPTLHEGARDAAEAKRPLLLWLMNGHPLGCT